MNPPHAGSGPNPRISVVVPTFNRLGMLEGAVNSVLAQTYGDIELIVVDDGSEDGTPGYLGTLTDPRVRSVRLAHSGNIAVVRNAGVAIATGTCLAFLDDDDLWEPEKLARQMERMAAKGARWSYTGYALIGDERPVPVPHDPAAFRRHPRGVLYGLLTTESSATICSVAVQRTLFEQVGGFDESLILRQDYDLVLRLAEQADPAILPEPLVTVRVHGGRTTAAARDPFLNSAAVYERYLRRPGPRRHAGLARRLRMRHLVSSAVRAGRMGARSAAARMLLECAWPGMASARWWWAWAQTLRGRLRLD